MIGGWFKIDRRVLDHPRSNDPDWLALWIRIMGKASHEKRTVEFDGKLIELMPGQFVSGRLTLAGESGIHESKVRRLLNLMKIDQQIDQQIGLKGSIFTVVNWAKYQGDGQQNGQRTANDRPLSRIKEGEEVPPPCCNHPPIANVMAYFAGKGEPQFSEPEIRRAWLDFEATKDSEDNWYHWRGQRKLGDWRAAFEDKLLFNRERKAPKVNGSSVNPIAERIGLEKQLEAVNQQIKRIDIPQGPLVAKEREAAIARRRPLLARRDEIKQRLQALQ